MINRLSLNDIRTEDISAFFNGQVSVSVLRIDLIHPVISGNKWFKLQYYLREAAQMGKGTVLTFGGAWSNHIVAAAAACEWKGFKSIGIIRGEESSIPSPTLLNARASGMQLHFMSREQYRHKIIPPDLLTDDPYIIPEGGYGSLGASGAAQIPDYATDDYTHYCCAVGTGTMMAGLINAARPDQTIVGIPVLKNHDSLPGEIQTLIHSRTVNPNWSILPGYEQGGYARYNPLLIEFMNDFYSETSIPSDFVYTGKLFYAINHLVQKGYFPDNSRLLLIHSGGLQGNASFSKGELMF